ncbi:MAG: CDP-diacylglycerol--glycerol-3-phosphate 3-phosphatidyltransferase [Slackia sp.]|uniref:CDP-diacylglycerol--glycerol-3-phosphate 3-phosphatidyltransferase n=1 Tax=Slackia sp. TaxID=2049041 RepID=UPI00283D20BD|nr:CDP-diacylglycerol--glycerol-3-phosphate 3-phosphatidyltransferase [Slackia sp.]MDR3900631.1 CDP-diacylglycerol--glycerol-3-phosphate 3-phosphatidyltransferase [Slackia sp.]
MAHDSKESYASGKPTPAGQGTVDKILTPANVVTMIRICLVPVFVVALIGPWPDAMGLAFLNPWKAWIAAIIFVVISCTDWLDGYLARSRGEVTDFGKFMDPLADKVLVVAALLVLIELGSLPSWPVLIIVAREFIVSGVRMVAASKGEVIAASWYGKFKTVFQMIAIVLFVVKESPAITGMLSHELNVALYILSWLVMAAALVLTIISMADYIWKARHLIGFKPKGRRAHVVNNDDLAAQAEDGFENELRVDAACAVVQKALATKATVATAESCTGGLIAASLTEVPGSSAVVRGGVVSYVNDVKMKSLDVPETAFVDGSAVCEDVAVAMALGAASELGADVACSVTGIAGPGGEEPGKPVGTVWIGISSSGSAFAKEFHFKGNRENVRAQATQAALEMILEAL